MLVNRSMPPEEYAFSLTVPEKNSKMFIKLLPGNNGNDSIFILVGIT